MALHEEMFPLGNIGLNDILQSIKVILMSCAGEML